jgi:hypothetical protein
MYFLGSDSDEHVQVKESLTQGKEGSDMAE